MRARLLLVGLLVGLAGPLGANDRLSLKVSPAVSFAPANLVIRAMVSADDNNRFIEIRAESDDFYRSSQIQLEGKKAPRTTLVYFRSLPGGAYHVSATLKDASGRQRAYVQSNITVIGDDPMDR
jgi:hypothetical protein